MGYKTLAAGLLLSSAVIWVAPTQAGKVEVRNPTWNVGATIGQLTRTGDITFNVSNQTAAGTGANIRGSSDSGMFYGLLLGADWYLNRFMFGLGLTADWQNADKEHNFHMVVPAGNHHDAHFRYDRSVAIGFFSRFGYQVTDYAMPYLKVGMQTSRDKMTYRGRHLNGIGVGAYDYTVNDRVTTLVFGAGLEIPAFITNTSFRFEYNYVAPDKVSMSVPLSTNANVANRVAYDPESHQARVSWVWNFH